MKTNYVHVGVALSCSMAPIGAGGKSLLNLSVQPKVHAMARKPLSEALSPKAVLELQSAVDAVLDKLILRFEGFAESGKVSVGSCWLEVFKFATFSDL